MNYSATQIENAKRNYTSFLKFKTLTDYHVETIGTVVSCDRMEYHNQIVSKIIAGDKALEKEWKLFFLNEEVKADAKKEASKNKLAANKEASADVLVSVKKAGLKLGDYYSWLKKSSFKKEFFSKKYSSQSVSTFINL